MALWLRYKEGGDLYSRRFDELELFQRGEVAREEVESGRGTLIEHRLWRRKQYYVTIGADVLSDLAAYEGMTNLEFMDNFWEGSVRYLSLSTSGTVPPDGEFVAVVCGSGVAPKEFIENHHGLPSYTLTLRQKYATP